MKVNVSIDAPILLLPLKLGDNPINSYDPDASTECWLIKMGDLSVKTDPKILDKHIKAEDKIYDIYNIHLNKLYMKYYRSI